MKLIGDRDDDGLDLGILQHPLIARIGNPRIPHGLHLGAEVVRDIADGVELRIAGLDAGVEVADLGDGTASENADAKGSIVLFDGHYDAATPG